MRRFIPRTIAGRAQKENKGLPKRWRKRGKSYRYQVPLSQRHMWDGKSEFTLGKTLPEAYRVWADRIELVTSTDHITVGALFDRYLLEVIPDKSYTTQKSNQRCIVRLRRVFGSMYIDRLELGHVREYLQLATKKYGDSPAYHLRQCFSHIMTMALQWGYVDQKMPITSIFVPKGVARDRYLTDAEVGQILSLESDNRGIVLVKLYLQFKLATGLRRGDILSILLSDIGEEGIYVQPRKTRKSSGTKLLFTWDEEGHMRGLVDSILDVPPTRREHLFVTRLGTPYINDKGLCHSFDSLWRRFVAKVMEENKEMPRFQERDFRAKVASESGSIAEASERLGHSGVGITKKVYIRKPMPIKPLIREY